jgi:hypothetical protein
MNAFLQTSHYAMTVSRKPNGISVMPFYTFPHLREDGEVLKLGRHASVGWHPWLSPRATSHAAAEMDPSLRWGDAN